MKFTAATIVTILSSAVAFSPNSMLSKSLNAANGASRGRDVSFLTRPMVASQEVDANSVNNGQRKKTKEVSNRI